MSCIYMNSLWFTAELAKEGAYAALLHYTNAEQTVTKHWWDPESNSDAAQGCLVEREGEKSTLKLPVPCRVSSEIQPFHFFLIFLVVNILKYIETDY